MRRSISMLVGITMAVGARANCDFSAVGARTQQVMAATNVTDGGIVIGTPRGILYKQYYGTYSDESVVAVASATKMLSGVRIMQLVDRGAIDLDTPVSTYLPEFTGTKGTMTMREMFSHTAGYGDDEDDPILAAPITLAAAVAHIACCIDQPYPPPGAYFAYGGISMQVGGEVAQVRSNEDWQAGWIAHVGAPLGITTIDWQGLGATQNYRIAGGAEASLPDYARVLAMLAGDGVGNGYRILSPQAVATLNHLQTGNAALGYSPPAADGGTAYGIGAWLEPTLFTDPNTPVISSIGKFGFTPWVDFGYGYFGALMIEQRTETLPTVGAKTHDALLDISSIVRAQLDPSCPLQETYDEIFRDGAEGLP
ncbi:MAG TPA: serine hydrolase domain-containing protein [Rudaea sp.]|nr:serine hydrolase domain-containing protein [Rudaea sp.]